MMVLFKQLQKKKNNFLKNFFLFSFIFFCTLQSSLAESFSDLLELNGSFAQGGLLFGKTNPKNKIFFNNKKIFVNESGDFILAIGRDEKLENLITIEGPKEKEKHKLKYLKENMKYKELMVFQKIK